MAHRCGLLCLHQSNPAPNLLHAVDLIFNSSPTHVSWSWPFTAFSDLQSTQSFLPSLFCVCRPDLLSSLLKLTFCLVLSNDERAHGTADKSLPFWEEIQSLTDTYQSPNTAERQNTSPSVFLLRCKVCYGKNAGCMWHWEKIWHISGIQLWSSL